MQFMYFLEDWPVGSNFAAAVSICKIGLVLPPLLFYGLCPSLRPPGISLPMIVVSQSPLLRLCSFGDPYLDILELKSPGRGDAGAPGSPRVLSGLAAVSNRLFPHAAKVAPRGSIPDASRFLFHR